MTKSGKPIPDQILVAVLDERRQLYEAPKGETWECQVKVVGENLQNIEVSGTQSAVEVGGIFNFTGIVVKGFPGQNVELHIVPQEGVIEAKKYFIIN
jgi:hypothetical protein